MADILKSWVYGETKALCEKEVISDDAGPSSSKKPASLLNIECFIAKRIADQIRSNAQELRRSLL